jgi:hypothetical protein
MKIGDDMSPGVVREQFVLSSIAITVEVVHASNRILFFWHG